VFFTAIRTIDPIQGFEPLIDCVAVRRSHKRGSFLEFEPSIDRDHFFGSDHAFEAC